MEYQINFYNKNFVILLLLLNLINSYAQISNIDLYKKAIQLEKKGDIKNAIISYKEYLKNNPNDFNNEKIFLKIARLESNINESLKYYKDFIEKFPDSRLRFIARYEYANLLLLNRDYTTSLVEFYNLAKISKKTPYWQKSLYNASLIEFQNNNFKKAIDNLYRILNDIDDYEDIGNSYFLLGKCMKKQNLFDDAEQFFLICAGSFPLCSKAPSALMELMNLYIEQKKFQYAKKCYNIINELYVDSIESKLIKKITNKELLSITKPQVEIELINLNENPDLKNQLIQKLKKDFLLSEISEVLEEENILSSGYYLQLGFYSVLDYAKEYLKKCSEKGITNIQIIKYKKNNDIFYRVVVGPYENSIVVNKKLIELKEKNIESIVIEIAKNYD